MQSTVKGASIQEEEDEWGWGSLREEREADGEEQESAMDIQFAFHLSFLSFISHFLCSFFPFISFLTFFYTVDCIT